MAERAESTDERLEEIVRRCVREELGNSRGSCSSQTLVNRTRNLIRSSASFAARQLGETSQQPSPTSEFRRNTPAMSARALDRSTSVTGHPLRKRKAPASKKKTQVVPKTVFLLDQGNLNIDDEDEDEGQNDEYVIKEEMILVKGEFDLLAGADEQSIRQELKEVFKIKFPLISVKDFDFVKRERNTIVTPVVKENHAWDYAHVKHLCGAGKLYVRLNICKDVIGCASDDSDSGLPTMLSTNDRPISSLASTPPPIVADDEVPTTSSGVSHMDGDISSLTVLFPDAKLSDIRDALIQCGSLELAAEKLSDKAATCKQPDACLDASQILKNLKLKMKGYGQAEKIKVDREDLLLDFFHYYKDSDFNPALQMKIQFRGEPAIDTGGVLHQAYEDAFLALAKGDAGLKMFQGPFERLVPIYRSDNVLNGVFEVLGKMVAHSMIQGGPGFPYLSPVIYWYIATGDLRQGIARASVIDISDGILNSYVTRVCVAFNFLFGTVFTLVRFSVSLCSGAKKCNKMPFFIENLSFKVWANIGMYNPLLLLLLGSLFHYGKRKSFSLLKKCFCINVLLFSIFTD